MSAVALGCYHTPSNYKRRSPPRRKVVSSICTLSGWMCELSCGHWHDTGPYRTSYGTRRPAPKSVGCNECLKVAIKDQKINDLTPGDGK